MNTSVISAAALALLLLGQGRLLAQPAPLEGSENAPDDAGALPVPPVPPRIAEGPEYDRCLNMLPSDPSGADSMAATWANAGGGEPAAHCHALAQIELGNPQAGAAMLDRLAAGNAAQGSARAELFSQAAQAWTMAGQADRAIDSATQGLNLSPDDVELRIGRALAETALQRFAEAVDDLSAALEVDPKRDDALTLRAGAYRNLQKLDLAQADIDHAFALDPENPETLLERGIIRQRRGDLAGARQDWEKAADLGEDTATADLAQQNLALLDAGPRQ
jgi:tetratricopeptide (TPR) repeat protein